MATTDVPHIVLTRDGINAATDQAIAAASGDGNSFHNSGREVVILEVAGAEDDVVATFVTQGTVDGNAVADKTVAVGANSRVALKPFPTSHYNVPVGQTDAGKVVVTWTGTITNASIMVLAP